MISPEQNRAVVDWLEKNSKCPLKALRLWALLFENVQKETGQIMLSRQGIAQEIRNVERKKAPKLTVLKGGKSS